MLPAISASNGSIIVLFLVVIAGDLRGNHGHSRRNSLVVGFVGGIVLRDKESKDGGK